MSVIQPKAANTRCTLLSDCLIILRKDWRRNLTGVIRATVAAFLPNYVEVNLCRIIAIVTKNPNL